MFKVRDNKTGKMFTVYDITYDADDDPYFLVYDDGIWAQYSASFYEPLEPDEIDSMKQCEVEVDIYDREEIHENCTVQVLTNSVTGAVSVGWWENEEEETK